MIKSSNLILWSLGSRTFFLKFRETHFKKMLENSSLNDTVEALVSISGKCPPVCLFYQDDAAHFIDSNVNTALIFEKI